MYLANTNMEELDTTHRANKLNVPTNPKTTHKLIVPSPHNRTIMVRYPAKPNEHKGKIC